MEAGHRCAIPTCRATTTEIAHIEPWAKSQNNSFSNLIVLCPNCHSRYDQTKEIDRKAIRAYKRNLALLNQRYGEFERRFFEHCARTGKRSLIVGAGAELLLSKAELDGLVIVTLVHSDGVPIILPTGENVFLPMHFLCMLTTSGEEFLKQLASGDELQ